MQHSFEFYHRAVGQVFRQVKNRTTKRIASVSFSHTTSQSVVVKLHDKMGLAEYVKTLLKFKIPVIGARPEKLAIARLQNIGVAVPAVLDYGEIGYLYQQQSFIVLEDLGDCYDLEQWVAEMQTNNNQSARNKKIQYINQVATIARRLHRAGLVHRDFYLCHFLDRQQSTMPQNTAELTLIDLHRCQPASGKSIIKDLAALLFSAEQALNNHDYLRFIQIYRQQPLRQILDCENLFWQAVIKRSDVLRKRNKIG